MTDPLAIIILALLSVYVGVFGEAAWIMAGAM